MIVVYVAGPFRAPTAWGIAENVRAAERLGLQVARLGAMPLIPHKNTNNFHGECTDEFWLEGTLELLRRCDAVVVLPGYERSSGTKGEIAEADRLGIPVAMPEIAMDPHGLATFLGSVEHNSGTHARVRLVPAVPDDVPTQPLPPTRAA